MEPLITHLPASWSICDPTSSSYDRPTVFLDRDGTLNIDTGYCHKPEDFVFYPDVTDGLNLLLKYDYRLIVVTNQSGIGRQYYSREDFIILNSWMLKLLSDDEIFIASAISPRNLLLSISKGVEINNKPKFFAKSFNSLN